MDFRYYPIDLNRPTFRLLRLKAGKEDDPLECGLIEAAFDEDNSVDYEAVSYTLGEPGPEEKISVDGQPLTLFPCLATILRDLRTQSEDRILWIDAICINNNDCGERGHQVSQMPTIFGRALRVLCWVCPLTEATSILMDSLQDLQRRVRNANWPPNDERYRIHWQQVQEHHPGDQDTQKRALETIFEQAWFNRAWIVQEIANARSASIYCGHKAVSSQIFVIAPGILDVTPPRPSKAFLEVMPGPLRRLSGWYNMNRDLYSILRRFSGLYAVEDRDRIYALLSLSPSANAGICIDYTKPIEDVINEAIAVICGCDVEHLHGIHYRSMDEFDRDLGELHNKVLIFLLESGSVDIARFFRENRTYITLTDELIDAITSSPINGETAMRCAPLEADGVTAHNLPKSALVAAARNGHSTIVRLLLDVNMDWKHESSTLRTSLQEATANGHQEVVQILSDWTQINQPLDEEEDVVSQHTITRLYDGS